MKTKSINLIVRDTLLTLGLPLHYYTRFLHHALIITDELGLDFDMGNVKTTELSVTSYGRVILPADVIDIIDVSAKYGDRLVPFERDRQLNKKYNFDDSGNKIKYPDPITEQQYRELYDRLYGKERDPHYRYDIDKTNSELVLGNKNDLTKVTVTYTSSAVSKSSANTVTPYANDVITKYILLQYTIATGGKVGDRQLAMMEYNNSRRVFRSRMNAMDKAEILGAIRAGIHGGVKN
jgi:hypothetical protein